MMTVKKINSPGITYRYCLDGSIYRLSLRKPYRAYQQSGHGSREFLDTPGVRWLPVEMAEAINAIAAAGYIGTDTRHPITVELGRVWNEYYTRQHPASPDITLTNGRTVRHQRELNGSQTAYMADGGTMSEAEANEARAARIAATPWQETRRETAYGHTMEHGHAVRVF